MNSVFSMAQPIKNFVSYPIIREVKETALMILGILGAGGIALGGCYGLSLGISKLIGRVGSIPSLLIVTSGTIALIWGICYVGRLWSYLI